MGSILSAYAYVEPVLAVVLNDLQADGTLLKLRYYLRPGCLYEITYYDEVSHGLITVHGKYVKFIKDYYGPEADEVTTIVMDVSKETYSSMTNIRISGIKSIELIEDFN